jgi:hypothetical protein
VPNRRLSISLWIGQLVLAVIFMTASYVKTSSPLEELAVNLPWTADLPGFLIRMIGVFEGLGALGLVLPALLRIQPALTPMAAGGLTLLMIFAAVFHLIRGELSQVAGVVVLGVLAGGVTWGRLKHAPITPAAEDEDDFDIDPIDM